MAQAQEVFLFQPTSVSGCQLWLDASLQSSVTLSGSTITQWTDRTANIVFTPASSPTYSLQAQNRQNVVTLNGSSQYFSSSFTINSATHTLIAIHKPNVGSSSRRIFAFQNAGLPYIVFPFTASPSKGYITSYDASTIDYINSPLADNSVTTSYNMIMATIQSGQQVVYLNGTSQSSTTEALSSSTTPALYLGVYYNAGSPSEFYGGSIGELIVYNSFLNTSQRQQVEGYLAWKWGLQGNLPANHPFKNYRPLAATPIPPQVPNMPTIGQTTQVFTPTQISGCSAWFDGADPLGTGIQPTLNTTLATWFDKSGNRRNASGGVPPTFTSGGVSFNGTTQYYTMSIPYPTNYSIFLVATNTTVAQCYFFARDSIAGSRYPTFIQGYIGAGIGLEWFEAADRATIATTPASPFMASVDHTQGGRIYGWYYGNESFNIPQTQAYNSAAWDTLGQAAPGINVGFYGGTMKELIFFSNVVTTAQRQQIEGYLAWKWGLVASLPNGHPYKQQQIAPFTFRSTPFQGSLNIWIPTRISGCQLWLDAADTATITLSGGNLSAIRDKSGTNKSLTVTNTVGYISKTAIVFTDNLGRLAVASMPASPYDYVMVCTGNSSISGFRTMLRTANTPGTHPYLIEAGTNNVGMYDGFNVSLFSSITQAANEKALFYGSMGANRTIQISKNGTISLSSPSNAGNESIITWIGNSSTGGQPFGQLQELVIYSGTLSLAQRQQVEGYLAWKWSLQGSLPANHPYKLFPPSP
jgi:hypothetical protein